MNDLQLEDIKRHPAWHGELDTANVTNLLEGSGVTAFILTQGSDRNSYLLSYAKAEDRSIFHVILKQDNKKMRWLSYNGATHTSKTLEGVICKAMHCPPEECLPFVR